MSSPLPWYKRVEVHVLAALTTIGLLAVLLWRAFRHRESVNDGLEDFVARSRLQTEALRAVLAEAEAEQARAAKELESIKLEAETAKHIEQIQNMDAAHVADEWNRGKK
jgi:hypothetical protein